MGPEEFLEYVGEINRDFKAAIAQLPGRFIFLIRHVPPGILVYIMRDQKPVGNVAQYQPGHPWFVFRFSSGGREVGQSQSAVLAVRMLLEEQGN